jgi:hypothetical protein
VEYPSPKFVAVEYDEQMFLEKIVKLRSVFHSCKERNREIEKYVSDEELELLSSCIGYDGDIHKKYYTESTTIWLDVGREAPQGYFSKECGSQLYNKIANYLQFVKENALSDAPIDRIQKYLEHENDGPDQQCDGERDRKWFDILAPHLVVPNEEYSFIIVGFLHTEDKDGRIRKILEQHGHSVEVHSSV